MQNKKPFHEQVAEKIIKQLEQGTAPWQKPWGLGQTAINLMPYNPVTGNRYKGINAINLMFESGSDNRWLTYKQAESIGAQVRKGEKGTPIQYWQFTEKIDKRDENGKKILDAEGKPLKVEVQLERPRVYFATVFNAAQIENMPPKPTQEKGLDWDPVERAENILKESKAIIKHDQIDRAYYRPSTDEIHLPFRDSFPDASSYYAVALHELGHWTGHESRLNRDLKHPFGSEGYAKEELRAEISSMMVGLELGLGYDPSNHASYVNSWIKVLQDDPKEILRAASDSEKIYEFVLSHERRQEINVEIEKTPVIEPIKQVEKIYISVPYEDKDEAKSLGAKWDRQEKSWYYIEEENADKFLKWKSEEKTIEQKQNNNNSKETEQISNVQTPVINEIKESAFQETDKVYIAVPYEDKDEAKSLGAKWDIQEKSWYVDGSSDLELFNKWDRKEPSIVVINSEVNINKEYINVPYEEKDEAAELGAKWDRQEKSWYIEASEERENFKKWINNDNLTSEEVDDRIINERENSTTKDKVYIAVPYEDKDEAKSLGAKWDIQEKSWYRDANDDAKKFTKWEVNPAKDYQSPAVDPREEFRQAMQSMNIDVSNTEHPIDDGKWHRLRTNDDPKGKKSASYKFYSDGRPAGVINNFKQGEVVKWVSKGYVLSDEERSRLAAISAEKNRERELERINNQNAAADKAKSIINNGTTVGDRQDYLTKKGIEIEKGVYVDQKNNLLVPLQDIDNNIRNVQTIYSDGSKFFVKEGQKKGAFHVLGHENGKEAIQKSENVVFAEGYATAASIKQTMNDKNTAYIVAFDAGNLKSVVENVMNEFPDKTYLIAGDDDKHLTMRDVPLENTGVLVATDVAEEFGITAVFPTFPKDEFNKNPKALTDFNDLMKLNNGKEMVNYQISSALNHAKQKSMAVANDNNHKQVSIKRSM